VHHVVVCKPGKNTSKLVVFLLPAGPQAAFNNTAIGFGFLKRTTTAIQLLSRSCFEREDVYLAI
jgi:hypothetical protein